MPKTFEQVLREVVADQAGIRPEDVVDETPIRVGGWAFAQRVIAWGEVESVVCNNTDLVKSFGTAKQHVQGSVVG